MRDSTASTLHPTPLMACQGGGLKARGSLSRSGSLAGCGPSAMDSLLQNPKLLSHIPAIRRLHLSVAVWSFPSGGKRFRTACWIGRLEPGSAP